MRKKSLPAKRINSGGSNVAQEGKLGGETSSLTGLRSSQEKRILGDSTEGKLWYMEEWEVYKMDVAGTLLQVKEEKRGE